MRSKSHVDFHALRQRIQIERVCDLLGIQLKKTGCQTARNPNPRIASPGNVTEEARRGCCAAIGMRRTRGVG
jgi:hypothetical protein